MTAHTDSASSLDVFIDYQVLDHLYRIACGSYMGSSEEALKLFREGTSRRCWQVWMSEIAPVEMVIGLENPALDDTKREQARMTYPCSRFSHEYSRLNLSFRFAGPDWDAAKALEDVLLSLEGVSAGDGPQLVSCIFGMDARDTKVRPSIQWLVTEDRKLRAALHRERAQGRLDSFSGIEVASVAEFVAASNEKNARSAG
jgi:hypothetical protein